MRVGIDVTCWSNKRGYGRYARGLITALLTDPAGVEFVLFTDNHTYAKTDLPSLAGAELIVVNIGESPSEAATAEQRRSLRDMRAMGAAVSRTPLNAFFFPSTYTYFPIRTKARILVGIHDVIVETYPELVFPARKRRYLWHLKTWLARRQADVIVTVSEYARTRIMSQFNLPWGRTWVVGEAPDPVFRPITNSQQLAAVRKKYGPGQRPYLIALGGLNPHKNIGTLLQGLVRLRQLDSPADLQLVLVGPAETDSFSPGVDAVRETIHTLGLDEAVHLTGFIADEEVVCLLNEARALVMPSFEEGFGLGAVEAAACGIPVVATKNSPLPQLLAGAGYFPDPEQPEAWFDALRKLLGDEAERQRLAKVALDQARKLTWAKAAGQFRSLLAAIERGER